MSPRKIAVITKREYLSRLKTKGFWLATIALPLLMAAWMVLPSLIMAKSKGQLRLVAVDATGRLGDELRAMIAEQEGGERRVEIDLEVVAAAGEREAQARELDARVLADEIDAWLWLDEEGLAAGEVAYHGSNLSNFFTLEALEGMLSRIVRRDRLERAGYDAEEIAALSRGIDLATVQVSEEGERAGGGVGDFVVAIGLFTILYMTLLIYGNMILQGVLEEKSNRVVEVIAATARPVELMAGKLVGIAGVALTQIGIWLVSALALTAPGLLGALAVLPEETPLPSLSLAVILHFVAHFVLGFVLYASFYALIGAAFNNPQEAQQLASFGVVFLVLPWMVLMPVLDDPDGTIAVVTSLIPLLTPMIMMLRVALDMPPAWQLALGYALTIALDVLMVWVCARVWRVGILMYGKRPTIREIWRWMRYA